MLGDWQGNQFYDNLEDELLKLMRLLKKKQKSDHTNYFPSQAPKKFKVRVGKTLIIKKDGRTKPGLVSQIEKIRKNEKGFDNK